MKTFGTGFALGSCTAVFIASILHHSAQAQQEKSPAVQQTSHQVEVVTEIEEEASRMVDDLAILKAYIRDRDLSRIGYAPYGWEQPTLDEYELLDGRTSLLPYEYFMKAVAAGVCSPEDGAKYAAWVAQQPAD
jgi:hypothetical protein